MLKRVGKFISVLFVILLLSFVVEIFVFQGSFVFGGHVKSKFTNVGDYHTGMVVDEDGLSKKVISFDLNGKFVNKLRIHYSSSQDIPSTVTVYRKDALGKEIKEIDSEVFHNEIHYSIRDYHKNIDKIEIISDSNLKINDIHIDNTLSFNYYRICYLFVFFWCVFLVICFIRKVEFCKKIENVFLAAIIPIGMMLIIVQPPLTFFSWDDQNHYQNTFYLLDSNIEWDQVSNSFMTPFPFQIDSIDSLEEQEEIIKYLNQASSNIASVEKRSFFVKYSEAGYILPSVGLHISRFLHLPFSICFRIGKMINLLFYSIIVFFAIRNIKIGKRIMMVIGLLPTTVYMACQYSYDPPITAATLLGFSFLINVLVDKNTKMDLKNTFLILIPLIFASFIKAVYAPLILMVLFIPKERFVDNKQAVKFKLSIVFIFILLVSTFVLPTLMAPNVIGDPRGGETSEAGQLATILHHPIGYMEVLKNTMLAQFMYKFFSKEILTNFAYAGFVSDNLYYIYLALLLFVSFTDTDEKYGIKPCAKVFMFLFIIGIILLIWTSMYMAFTDVGSSVINGVQARYFIPLLFPFIMCFQFSKIKNQFLSRYYDFVVMFVPVCVLLFTIYNLIIKVYCC